MYNQSQKYFQHQLEDYQVSAKITTAMLASAGMGGVG